MGVNYEYTPVEYIESTGTQYIDSGLSTFDVYKIEAEAYNTFGLVYSGTTYGGSLVGARASATDSVFQYGTGASNDFIGNGTSQTSLTKNTNTAKITLNYTKANYSITCGNYNASGSLNVVLGKPFNMYVFALNNNGTPSYGTFKLLYLKMYDCYNNLMRDFIPVLDTNNVPCLFDRTHGKFYYNIGTGSFSYGTAGTLVSKSVAMKYFNSYKYGDGANNSVSNGYVDKIYLNGIGTSQSGGIRFTGNYNLGIFQGNATNSYATIYQAIHNNAEVDTFGTNKNTRYTSGTNTIAINLSAGSEPKTCLFDWRGNGRMSNSCYYKDLKFKVSGTYYSLSEMVANSIIKPIVLISSSRMDNSTNYLFSNVLNMYTAGQTDSKSYSCITIAFMLNRGYTITDVQFYSSYAAPASSISTNDGFSWAMCPISKARLTLN